MFSNFGSLFRKPELYQQLNSVLAVKMLKFVFIRLLLQIFISTQSDMIDISDVVDLNIKGIHFSSGHQNLLKTFHNKANGTLESCIRQGRLVPCQSSCRHPAIVPYFIHDSINSYYTDHKYCIEFVFHILGHFRQKLKNHYLSSFVVGIVEII